MAKTIYLSPERRPGPSHGVYAYGDAYERDVCCEIAQYAREALERCGFTVCVASPAKTIYERVDEANEMGADYYLPIHTNAGGGTGAEVLACDHPDSLRACQLIYDELVRLYPSRRGVKVSNFYEVVYSRMVSAYPEIAFHDNVEDARFILENKREIAEALCRGVCAYFGVAYRERSATKPNPDFSSITLEELVGCMRTEGLPTSLEELGEMLKEKYKITTITL